MDRDINRAASLFESYGLGYYTDDASEVLSDKSIDLIYIASNHASHAEYAIKALERGKHVHIEKPHVVSEDQLKRLCRVMEESSCGVTLGFNRPHSRIGREIRTALGSQTGAAVMNWFIAGHELPPDHWYFTKEEGGRVLGNLCHWTDLVYHMVPPSDRYPITITPTRSDKSDCDIAVCYTFGDGTIAAITFSAKGHCFEGVRERFAAHRGNVLVFMDDFQRLIIEDREHKRKRILRYRDHGHEENVLNSYRCAFCEDGRCCTVDYVWETAHLFLMTRKALEQKKTMEVHPYGAVSASL
jgi:predicted dehydrogenase